MRLLRDFYTAVGTLMLLEAVRYFSPLASYMLASFVLGCVTTALWQSGQRKKAA